MDYLKIPELSRRLDVSEPTVRRMIKGGKLPSVFVGGAYRVSEADLAKYLEAAKVRPGKASAPLSLDAEPAGREGSEVSHEAQRRRFNYWAGGIEDDVGRWEEWIAEVRESADVPGTDKRTWARTVGMAAMQRYGAAEAQGAVEAMKADGGRTPEGKRLRAALEALLTIPQAAADASVGARQVSAVLEEVEGKAPETLALEKRATLALEKPEIPTSS